MLTRRSGRLQSPGRRRLHLRASLVPPHGRKVPLSRGRSPPAASTVRFGGYGPAATSAVATGRAAAWREVCEASGVRVAGFGFQVGHVRRESGVKAARCSLKN